MDIVTKHLLKPDYQESSGKLLVALNQAPLPHDFPVRDKAFVRLPAGAVGGNHYHSCAEAFISSDPETELHWLDEQGVRHVEKFVEGDKLFAIVVSPLVPHAVHNAALDHSIMLLEFRDGLVENPVSVAVVAEASS